MKNLKNILATIVVSTVILLGGCTDADVASHNLKQAAEAFELERRIVFYNGITNEYILVVEGKCSVEETSRRLEVTCKVGNDDFKKHQLGLSDNVTYFSEQQDSVPVDVFHYRVIFKPEAILPNIDLVISLGDNNESL